mmetsp:Transcript_12475/g.19751  ORF Transcript_12475/g.19751 Transcript_12475/m.19751 type:complete len:286 (+) Transcript_12475:108-965(+)
MAATKPQLLLPSDAVPIRSLPQALAEQTPVNAASTHWRTVVSPSAPEQRQANCWRRARTSSDFLASPASMSVAGSPMSEVMTPAGVAMTSWRHHVCPNAPQRHEVLLSSPLASPAGSLAGTYSFPPTPVHCLWPSSTSGTPMHGSGQSTPVMLFAPEPRRAFGRVHALSLDSSMVSGSQALCSPTRSPLNCGFIASPGSSTTGASPLNLGFVASPGSTTGMSITSRGFAGFEPASPFFSDVTPIGKAVGGSPASCTASFHLFSRKDSGLVLQEDVPRRPLGPANR